MKIIILLCLFMIIMLGALAFSISAYTQFCLKIMVQNKYEVINEIITKEKIPSKWRKKLLEEIALRHEKSNHISILSEGLKQFYLYKLNRIISYVEHNPVFKKNDKEMCMNSLTDIKECWKSSKSINDLIEN